MLISDLWIIATSLNLMSIVLLFKDSPKTAVSILIGYHGSKMDCLLNELNLQTKLKGGN